MKFLKKILVWVFLVLIIFGGIREIRERWGTGGSHFAPINIGASRDKQETKLKSLKFAVMSDIHSDINNFRNALLIAKNNGVEFVIVTGDLTTVGANKELLAIKKVLDESGLRYYAIPGNHDHWTGRRTKQNIFNEVFGKDYQSFVVDNNKFILIDNGKDIEGLGEQYKWIEKETEECLKIFCLVFMHEPLNHAVSAHIMGEDYPNVDKERLSLISLLQKNNAINIFAGHLHYYSTYEIDGLTTNLVGAVNEERNAQSPKYTEVILSENKIEKKEVFIK